jgi:CysZ protein
LAVVVVVTALCIGLVFVYHQEILNFLWAKPESRWLLWVWYVFSWILSLLLVVGSSLISYLISQILFCVMIMDTMSRITERMVTGQEKTPRKMPFFSWFFYLIKQETPRAILPVFFSFLLLVLGWLTPVGPLMAILSSLIAAMFLAWDNTDLVPARRLYPFRSRFKHLTDNVLFHVGFGLLFLIPIASIVFLSFAPVGATLYYIDSND